MSAGLAHMVIPTKRSCHQLEDSYRAALSRDAIEADRFERALDRHGSRAFCTSTAAARLVHKQAACCLGLGLANITEGAPQSRNRRTLKALNLSTKLCTIRSASIAQRQVTSSQDGLPRPRQFCNAVSTLSCKATHVEEVPFVR